MITIKTETPFNLHEEVFFFNGSKICKGEIVEVIVRIGVPNAEPVLTYRMANMYTEVNKVYATQDELIDDIRYE